jgi:TolA-binding protein
MEELRNNPTHLDVVNQSVRKYNVALRYCEEGSLDVAVIQLKKILQSNPNFLAAHQLLGLLYLNNGSYSKAKKELTRALRIDNGSTKTRFYLQEAEKMLSPDDDDDKTVKERSETGDVIEYRSGNDTIIQPVHSMQPKGTVSLISVFIGIVLGLLAAIFLVLPAKIQDINDEASARIAAISEEGDLKSSLLQENQNTVNDLNDQIADLQATIESYSENDVTVEAMNELMAAVDVYIQTPNDTKSIAEHMDLVNMDKISESASEEFSALYGTMMELVGPTLSDYYYKLGYKAYTSQDYDSAITDLAKSYCYDNTNEPALYFLGSAYYENGDYDKAKKAYNEVMSLFPDTKYANNAETKIAEINNLEE